MKDLVKEFLREQGLDVQNNLFIRPDPDSEEAYFELEEPDEHINVGASYNGLQFVWDRKKSNQNLNDHLFSHYLTRRVYNDKYRIINGKKVGRDIVNIKTDAGNTGLLCAYDLRVFDPNINEEDNIVSDVVVIVRQDTLQNGRIRLISCYPTNNRLYIRWYLKNKSNIHFASSPSAFDKINIPTHIRERMDEFRKIQEEIYNDVIEEWIDEAIANIKVFNSSLRSKTMPKW